MAFATYEDIQARWRNLTEDEQQRAATLLDDAAVYLNALVEIDSDNTEQAAALRTVSCSMVIRAMVAAENNMLGIKSQTISADIYSQTFSLANPTGDLYITAAERKLLGITDSYVINVRPVIEPRKGGHHDIWGEG